MHLSDGGAAKSEPETTVGDRAWHTHLGTTCPWQELRAVIEDAGEPCSAASWGQDGKSGLLLPPSLRHLSPQTGRKEEEEEEGLKGALTLCSPVWAGWGKGPTGGVDSLTCTWRRGRRGSSERQQRPPQPHAAPCPDLDASRLRQGLQGSETRQEGPGRARAAPVLVLPGLSAEGDPQGRVWAPEPFWGGRMSCIFTL